jgi:hypothetical protein
MVSAIAIDQNFGPGRVSNEWRRNVALAVRKPAKSSADAFIGQ